MSKFYILLNLTHILLISYKFIKIGELYSLLN